MSLNVMSPPLLLPKRVTSNCPELPVNLTVNGPEVCCIVGTCCVSVPFEALIRGLACGFLLANTKALVPGLDNANN